MIFVLEVKRNIETDMLIVSKVVGVCMYFIILSISLYLFYRIDSQ